MLGELLPLITQILYSSLVVDLDLNFSDLAERGMLKFLECEGRHAAFY